MAARTRARKSADERFDARYYAKWYGDRATALRSRRVRCASC